MKKVKAQELVVGLDVGTTKICAVIGEPQPGGGLDVVGVGNAPSRGLRRGVVVNIDSTVEAIKQAVARTLADRRELAHVTEVRSRIATLTPREAEVFALVVTGMLNKQIGDKLGIVEKTVKVHRARVMEKMRAASIAELVRLAGVGRVIAPQA